MIYQPLSSPLVFTAPEMIYQPLPSPLVFTAPEMLDPKAQRSQHSSRGSPTSTTPAPPDERSPWPVRRQLPPSPLVRSSVQAYARSQEEQNESCLVQASNDATHRYYDYMYVSVVTLYLVQAFIFF